MAVAPKNRSPRRMARRLALTIVCAGALVVAGCASEPDQGASEPTVLAFDDQTAPTPEWSASADSLTIGVLVQNTSRSFFQGLEKGARERAEELGVELLVHDAEDSADAQLEGAQDLLATGVDALAISPVDSSQAIAIVELAEAAGVPVVSVANQVGAVEAVGPQFVYPGTLALVTNDDIDMGRKAATFVAQLVGDDPVTLSILEGKQGTANVTMRYDGFSDELDALAIDYRVSDRASGDWTADGGRSVCAGFAADPELQLIFSMSDAMTAGCAESLDAAGRTDIDVVSIGGNEAGIALLKAGAMVGTVCQKPATMGSLAIEVLTDALATDVPIVGLRFYETPVVTIENQPETCIPQW